MNISFSGCGFLGIYHVGVIQAFRENAPSTLQSFQNFAGASAGAIASLVVVSGCPAGKIHDSFITTAEKARAGWTGPFSPSFDCMAILHGLMDETLPPNIHREASNRLHVSLTAVPSLKNRMVSQFNTRLELIKVRLWINVEVSQTTCELKFDTHCRVGLQTRLRMKYELGCLLVWMQVMKATCYIPVWAGLQRHTYRGEVRPSFSNKDDVRSSLCLKLHFEDESVIHVCQFLLSYFCTSLDLPTRPPARAVCLSKSVTHTHRPGWFEKFTARESAPLRLAETNFQRAFDISSFFFI